MSAEGTFVIDGEPSEEIMDSLGSAMRMMPTAAVANDVKRHLRATLNPESPMLGKRMVDAFVRSFLDAWQWPFSNGRT